MSIDNSQIPNILFSGDTIFQGGCGKFFEGTSKNMFDNFMKIKALPKNTYILPGIIF